MLSASGEQSKPNDRSLGQIAFEAYGDNREWRDWRGMPMPAWTAVSIEIQAAWEVAAEAVSERVVKAGHLGRGRQGGSPFTKWREQPMPKNWRDALDDRERSEVNFSMLYAESYSHGTDGHNAKIIIAKMAAMLDVMTAQAWVKENAPQ